ncbi:MAG: N-acetylglucosamine-6-phosphate deacetylase [Victivallaceae bacterium]|nr:N-acetylglucosamine-6-phosphate deacetylase [Victivallaceae bacterium]
MERKRSLYIADYCLTPHKRIEHGAILCQEDRILAIGGASAFAREEGLEVIEFANIYSMPGFIDSHLHGAGGFDCSSAYAGKERLEDMSSVLARHGVTAFVPTVVSAPSGPMLENLAALADMITAGVSGADPIGIHIEGPFINPEKHGTQLPEDLKPVDLGFCRELIQAGRGKVKKMTLAPELDHAVELIELLLENNIMPSMGHSVADEKATLKAIDAGAHYCTHLFNGMPALHQRDVTLTGVALTDSRVNIELIIDGHHLHPRIIDLACRCKPEHQVSGISDAVMAVEMAPGTYHVGAAAFKITNGIAQTADGLLAGTTTLLDSGWHSLMTYSHMEATRAAACVTANPALTMGLEDRGILLPQKRADIAFFECGTNRPVMTVCQGKIVFDAGINRK